MGAWGVVGVDHSVGCKSVHHAPIMGAMQAASPSQHHHRWGVT